MSDGENGRINVSRDALRAELAQMELRLVEKLATKAEVENISLRLATVEAHGTPHAQEQAKELVKINVTLDSLVAWRNRLVGGYVVIAAIVIPLAVEVSRHL